MVQLAKRIERLKPSLVREILSVTARSEIISLAGGLPAREAMALPAMPPDGWQQYGESEGDMALRTEIAALLRGRGLDCPPERILVTTGSQQGLDLAAKLLIEEETPVAVESPTYLAALQVFRLFGADLRAVGSGMEGPSLEAIEGVFGRETPRCFYAMPLISNPTGGVWSGCIRQKLVDLCDAHGTVLLEDDPYRETAAGDHPPPLVAALRRASWIHLGSFSKSLLPGIDTMALLEPCLKSGVAFLPGTQCLPEGGVSDWMRLNFSSCDPDRAREGLRRIKSIVSNGPMDGPAPG